MASVPLSEVNDSPEVLHKRLAAREQQSSTEGIDPPSRDDPLRDDGQPEEGEIVAEVHSTTPGEVRKCEIHGPMEPSLEQSCATSASDQHELSHTTGTDHEDACPPVTQVSQQDDSEIPVKETHTSIVPESENMTRPVGETRQQSPAKPVSMLQEPLETLQEPSEEPLDKRSEPKDPLDNTKEPLSEPKEISTESQEPLEEVQREDPARTASKEEEEDEEDVVIRPRSRAKRATLSQEPDIAPTATKKLKIEAATKEKQANAVSGAIHSNDEDDDEGNEKVDEHGFLKGDRSYTAKVFRLPMRGDTYYFLATEIARESGYRDSYLLFNKNRNLKKLMTTEAEKAFLIQQELIPYSYRNRQIGVVKALSIYKTFGARVIRKGMRVKDDYFAQRARDSGYTETDYANEDDRPVEVRLHAQAEAQKRADSDADGALGGSAKGAAEYNRMINQQRKDRQDTKRSQFRRVFGVPTGS